VPFIVSVRLVAAMSVRLYIRLDYPLKDAVIKVDDKATLADLKAAVAKAFTLSEDVAKRYTYQAASFKVDAYELGKGSKGDEEPLADQGVKEGFTVIGRAPSDLKPIRKRKDKEDEDDKKKDSGTVSVDRYKGLSLKNVLKKFVEKQGKHKLAGEYIDIYATAIFKQKEFTKLSKEILLLIIKSDTLSIKEVDLFDAVLTWGKAQCKEQKLDGDKAEDLKKVLADVLPHVRFPAMTTTDVAVKVTNSGLLESDQILDLFTYLGMKSSSGDKLPSLGKSLKGFDYKDRKGRKPPSWFKWDSSKKNSNLTVSDDGITVTSSTTSYYMPVVGDVELTDGTWEYETVLQNLYSSSYSVCIGFVPTSWTNYTGSCILGYYSHMSVGWSFDCYGSVKYDGSSSGTTFGRQCTTGSVVKCKVDLDKKTLEYFCNDSSLGVAHTNVTGPVRPAMSHYGYNTTKLQFPK